jgi:hypothetical protein
VVQPVIKLALMLFGSTPGSLYANLDRLYSVVTRGLHFAWEGSDNEGHIEARFEGPGIRSSLFEVTRGNLSYILEVCRARGTVGEPMVVKHDDSGAVVRYRTSWA